MSKTKPGFAEMAEAFNPYIAVMQLAPLGKDLMARATATAQRSLDRQESLTAETLAFGHRWLERRQQAAADATVTARAVLKAGPNAAAVALTAMSDWYSNAAQRTAADLREPFDLMTLYSKTILPSGVEPGSARPEPSLHRVA